VFIEVFRALASRQRMFGEMQLAEGEKLESNILQLCPMSKYFDSEAICKASCRLSEAAGRRAKFESHYVRLTYKCARSIITPIRHRGSR
jgi:hypothetical protein